MSGGDASGGWGPQKWGADKAPARDVREILLWAEVSGSAPRSARGRVPMSVGAASAEALPGPCAPHPVRPPGCSQSGSGREVASRQGDPAQGSGVSRLSQGSCLVSASLALPQQIK